MTIASIRFNLIKVDKKEEVTRARRMVTPCKFRARILTNRLYTVIMTFRSNYRREKAAFDGLTPPIYCGSSGKTDLDRRWEPGLLRWIN